MMIDVTSPCPIMIYEIEIDELLIELLIEIDDRSLTLKHVLLIGYICGKHRA